MARPTTRTVVVETGAIKRVFGTAATAFRNLEVAGEISYSVFYRAWQGDPVSPAAARAVESGWRGFVDRMQQAPREMATGG